MKPTVLTFGNIYMRSSYDITSVKTHGVSYADEASVEPSGFSVTCSTCVARLGGDSLVCASVGGDFFGAKIRQFCESEGISTRFLKISPDIKTGSEINLGYGNYIIRYKGANPYLFRDDIDNACLSYPNIAIIDTSVEESLGYIISEHTKKYGIKTVVSLSGLEYAQPMDYICGSEVIVTDARSAYAISGTDPKSPDQCVKACLDLYKKFKPAYVVLRLGERGSLSYDGKHCEFYPGFETGDDVLSITESSFVGAFALDFAKNENVAHACMAGNIVSSITQLGKDSIFDFPDANYVNSFIKEKNIKI